MLQIISPNENKIVLEPVNPEKNIDMLNNHILSANCKYLTVDITGLNVLDACRVSTLCSAQHYIKYPDGEIKWLINSKEIEAYNSSMSLGNSIYSLI